MSLVEPRTGSPRHARPGSPAGPVTRTRRSAPAQATAPTPTPALTRAEGAGPAGLPTRPGCPQPARPPASAQAAIPMQVGPHPAPRWGMISPGEPPAGLGPWTPPLPAPAPPLSARATTWLGIVAVTLIIAAGTAIGVVIGASTAPDLTRSDGLYLGSVRDNSGLSRLDISDDDLVRTGRGVCAALDAQPSTSAVFGTMEQLGVTNGWTDDDVAAVVGSAIGAYCPWHLALVGT